uniref:Uncharacterized protein n=1 Tax=Anopheles minimus TaxID=112268 RepID=A0A182WQ67_9DIPT
MRNTSEKWFRSVGFVQIE